MDAGRATERIPVQISSRQKVMASLAAIGCFGTLAAAGIFGAFSAQSVNSFNEFSSATLTLNSSNDAVSQPVYSASNAVPGDSGNTEHSCIEITYTGTVPAEVRLFGEADDLGTGLAPGVMLRISEGDGGVEDGCDSFLPLGDPGDVFGGALGDSLQTIRSIHTLWDNGIQLGTWDPGESHVYRFESWLSASLNPVNMQGKTAGNQSFVWEARAGA